MTELPAPEPTDQAENLAPAGCSIERDVDFDPANLPQEHRDGPESGLAGALDFTSEHALQGSFPEEFILAEQMDLIRSPEGW